MDIKKTKDNRWHDLLFLIVVSALVYLPRIREFTFFKDDWYFIYDGFIGGADIYLDVALHTRPIRGYLYQFLFSLFNINPFPYHFLLFVFRLLGGLSAFWLFNLIWKKQRKTNVFLALLVTIYPGFLWWTGGFEFQAYVISFGLGIFSIFTTLKSILAPSTGQKVSWAVISVISGWVYLALTEFYIGMEVFRVLAVYLLAYRQQTGFWKSVQVSLRKIGVFLLIPISFVVWYQFFFDNWRKAQDAGTQLSHLLSSPLSLLWAGIRFLQGSLNVTFFAWGTPFQQNYFGNRLTDLILGLLFGAIAVLLVLAYQGFFRRNIKESDALDEKNTSWQNEAFWLGLLGVIGAVLPVVLVNRNIDFDRLSHYALPASLAGVVFVGALLYTISSVKKRLFIASLLVLLATLTHHGAAAKSISNAEKISDFWWQVSWRAPHISDENSTTLLVVYPDINYAEGDEVAWAPANIIYYPETQTQSPIHLRLPAIRLESETLPDVLMASKKYDKEDLLIKNIFFNQNFKNILVLTQPTSQSCVHAIDSRWVGLSTADGAHVIAGAPHSHIENIVTMGDAPLVPEVLFGQEPPHTWCYFYQKADIARQVGNWEKVIEIFEEASANDLNPNDQIELIPFLQAYAYKNDLKAVKQLSTRINTENFYQQQACTILHEMGANGYPLSDEMEQRVDQLFCGKE